MARRGKAFCFRPPWGRSEGRRAGTQAASARSYTAQRPEIGSSAETLCTLCGRMNDAMATGKPEEPDKGRHFRTHSAQSSGQVASFSRGQSNFLPRARAFKRARVCINFFHDPSSRTKLGDGATQISARKSSLRRARIDFERRKRTSWTCTLSAAKKTQSNPFSRVWLQISITKTRTKRNSFGERVFSG